MDDSSIKAVRRKTWPRIGSGVYPEFTSPHRRTTQREVLGTTTSSPPRYSGGRWNQTPGSYHHQDSLDISVCFTPRGQTDRIWINYEVSHLDICVPHLLQGKHGGTGLSPCLRAAVYICINVLLSVSPTAKSSIPSNPACEKKCLRDASLIGSSSETLSLFHLLLIKTHRKKSKPTYQTGIREEE